MSDAVLELEAVGRDLGVWDLGRPGPTLLVIAGLHGNEPGGVLAAKQLMARLAELDLPIAGRIVALAGNVAALAAGRRYIDRDLNRGWSAAALAALRERAARQGRPDLLVEDVQQLELLNRFEAALETATGPVVVVDLHTSSAGGSPFLCLADTIENRRLGFATGVPIILGIEETIDGASLEWFADRGVMGIAVEAGQHEDPATVDNHEAVLWRMLDFLGMLAPARARAGGFDMSPWIERLERAVGSAPPIVEIVERRAIVPGDGFRMEPGFQNFQPIGQGVLLARDNGGEIRATRPGLVMLPLYQELGDDGYFLARTVRPFWLRLAAWLRALRFDALVPLLPGVRRDPEDPQTILVDPRVARWFVTEVFHLLGFRKRRQRGGLLAFTRRVSRPENRRLRIPDRRP